MKLDKLGLSFYKDWEEKGYSLPEYDREAVAEYTHEHPQWIHFGAGNIFRAFQANLAQTLLNRGAIHTGLIVAEGYDYEIIENMYHPHDGLSILVTLKANGTIEKTVIGSIVEALTLDSDHFKEFQRLQDIFKKETLQFASFTITEKGYNLKDNSGNFLPSVLQDMEHGPNLPKSYIGKITALLYARFLAGLSPLAMVSMDNCSHNGTKLYRAVRAFAQRWTDLNFTEKEFLSYIDTPQKVSFPWTMIDKITPRPDLSIKKLLTKDGIEDLEPFITGKNTYIAPFVNAEESEYLVIEDSFPNGRPSLEKSGVVFASRETVDKVEKMKVCTCLNPLHTALAIFGCLLGYELISTEMKDSTLRRLVEGIGYREGLPVAVDPEILNPQEFLDTVLTIRIPNPFMPDTPQRIMTDTSQKLAVRFGETIKAYANSPDLSVSDLKLIPLVLAGWLRYLMAIDDNGLPFQLSPDPMLDTLCPYLSGVTLGSKFQAKKLLEPILKSQQIFGVDLFEIEMADLVSTYFEEMTSSTGAVRRTLEKYVQ